MGRSRTLLVAALALLAAPASAARRAVPRRDDRSGDRRDLVVSDHRAADSTRVASSPSYRFDLGPTLAYGSSTPIRSSTVSTPASVSEKLGGLTPGTTYHFRLIGSTACGSEVGLDATFTTPLAPGQQPLPVVPLVFVSWLTGNAEVAIAGSDGSGPRVIAPSPASDFDPTLSPDGSRVVFASTRSGNGDLYVVGQDGTGLVQITTSRYADTTPAWSPDGRQVVFASSSAAGPGLFVVNADGTGRRRHHDREGRCQRSGVVAQRRHDRVRAHRQGHGPGDLHGARCGWRRDPPDEERRAGPVAQLVARRDPTRVHSFHERRWQLDHRVPVAGGIETAVTAASDFARNPVYTQDGTRIATSGSAAAGPRSRSSCWRRAHAAAVAADAVTRCASRTSS